MIIKLEVARRKFFNNDYGKYRNLCSASSINATENDSANSINAAKNDRTDWQFLVSQALCNMMQLTRKSIKKIKAVYSLEGTFLQIMTQNYPQGLTCR